MAKAAQSDTLVERWRTQLGQAVVEFALASSLVFMLIAGVVDVGRAVYYQSALQDAVRHGIRYAVVRGTGCSATLPNCPLSSSELTTQVQTFISWADRSKVAVSSTGAGGAAGSTVTVSATYAFSPFMGFFSFGNLNLSASAAGTITN
jgi:hypothetical protein